MLFQYGPHAFEIAPLNTHEAGRETFADFAEHPVIGRRPVLEAVGEGPEMRRFVCRLFPGRFGGEAELAALHQSRREQLALPLMRGDLSPLGWFVVADVRETHTHLDGKGVAGMLEVELTLRAADPGPAAAYETVMREIAA